MIGGYRKFRNSVMVVYDTEKSQYGMNPLTCYRLSPAAISALNLNQLSELTSTLTQDQISKAGLSIDSFFHQVAIKVHRSHLL